MARARPMRPRPSWMDREGIPKYKIRGTVMKINEILNYHQDQQLFQHIGNAFLQNGELKFPVDFGDLVPDSEPMLDRTADEVPGDIMDVATIDQNQSRSDRPLVSSAATPTKGFGSSALAPLSRSSTLSQSR
jgi:hypothetical protein